MADVTMDGKGESVGEKVKPLTGLARVLDSSIMDEVGEVITSKLPFGDRRSLMRSVAGELSSGSWNYSVNKAGLRHPGQARSHSPELTAFIISGKKEAKAGSYHPDSFSIPYALRHWSLERVLEAGPAEYRREVDKEGETRPSEVSVDYSFVAVRPESWVDLPGGGGIVAGEKDYKLERTEDGYEDEDRGDDPPLMRVVARLDAEGNCLWHTDLPPVAGQHRSPDVDAAIFADEAGERFVAAFEDNLISPLFDLFCLDGAGRVLASTTVNNVDACSWASDNFFKYHDDLFFSASSNDKLIMLSVWDPLGAKEGKIGGGGGRRSWKVEVGVAVRIFFLRGMEVTRVSEGEYMAGFFLSSIPRFVGTCLLLQRIRLGERTGEEVASFKLPEVTYLRSNAGGDLHFVDYRLGRTSLLLGLTANYVEGLTDRTLRCFGQRGKLEELMDDKREKEEKKEDGE